MDSQKLLRTAGHTLVTTEEFSMATLRFRNGKWQVQVRRRGYQARTQSFLNKTDAQRWARHIETELDRTLIPNDVRALAKVTLAELLIRYRDTVTINRRGLLPETKRIEAFLRQDWCAYPLAKLNARDFSKYRDERLKCVGPGTVIGPASLDRAIQRISKPGSNEQRLLAELGVTYRPRYGRGAQSFFVKA